VSQLKFSVFPLSPTRFGWFYFLFCVLMLVGCINYQLSLGYFFTFWLFALWPVAAVQAWRGLLGLSVTLTASEDVFAGDAAHFGALVVNPSGLTRFALRVSAGGVTQVGDAVAHSSSSIALALPTSQRGRLELRQVQVLARDPLGLFQALRQQPSQASLLVYPKPEAAPPPLPQHDSSAEQGQRAPATQSGDDFAGLRAYAPGDSLRRVAWRQAARSGALMGDGGGLMVKSFDAPVASQIHLRFDDTPTDLDHEQRLSRLCAWVLEAEKQRLPYAFTVAGLHLPASHGESQCKQALMALALLKS
jgi:uncharacterized protein (DUF58 family)